MNNSRNLIYALKREKEKNRLLSEKVDMLFSDDGLYEAAKRNTNVKNRIIGDYLSSLSSPVQLLGGSGAIALTPEYKPKTLADAKRLAEKIIKS